MTFEVETKIPILSEQIPVLMGQFAKMAASAKDTWVTRTRTFLDTLPEGKLLATGRLLRLNQGNSHVSLTAKTIIKVVGGISVRNEQPLSIEQDAQTVLDFCQTLLGFEPILVFQKRAVTFFTPDGIKPAIDITPLGVFMEVEVLVNDERQVDAAIGKVLRFLEGIGINPADGLAKSYLQLAIEHHGGKIPILSPMLLPV